MIKKVLLLLAFIVGLAFGAVAGTVTYDFTNSNWGFATSSASANATATEYTNSSTKQKVTAYKVYKASSAAYTMMVSTRTLHSYIQFPAITGKKITKVEVTTNSGAAADAYLTVSVDDTALESKQVGSNTSFTWNIPAVNQTTGNVIKLSNTPSASKNAQLKTVVLTYEDGGQQTTTTAAPTIAGTTPFDNSTTATISGSGTIYYTTNPAKITTLPANYATAWTSATGSATVNITESCWVMAVAKNGTENVSTITSKQFVKNSSSGGGGGGTSVTAHFYPHGSTYSSMGGTEITNKGGYDNNNQSATHNCEGSFTDGAITLTLSKGSGGSYPLVDMTGVLRTYTNNKLTFSSTKTVTQIKIYTDDKNKNLEGYTASGNVYTISNPAMTLTITSSDKTFITHIEVMYNDIPSTATPTITGTDNFTGSTSVSIACSETADIYYKTGVATQPSSSATAADLTSAGWLPYSSALTFTETTTVNAVALATGKGLSTMATSTFTQAQTVAPKITGTTPFVVGDKATLSASTGSYTSAVTYWVKQSSTDLTGVPTDLTGWTQLTGSQFDITAGKWFAVAQEEGKTLSAVSAAVTFTQAQSAQPALPQGVTTTNFVGSVDVTLVPVDGATIYWILGSSAPTVPTSFPAEGWTAYSASSKPQITATTNLYYVQVEAGKTVSALQTQAFTQAQSAAPVISASPLFDEAQKVFKNQTTITITGSGVQYKLNAGEWQSYSAPFTINETTTVTAKQTESGKTESSEVSVKFTKWSNKITDVISVKEFEITSQSGNATTFSDKTSNSSAVYAGKFARMYNSSNTPSEWLSINTTATSGMGGSGIITTASGGGVEEIRVNWNTNTSSNNPKRTIIVYGSETPYSSLENAIANENKLQIASFAYDSSNLNQSSGSLTTKYPYVLIVSTGGACQFNSIEIDWVAAQSLAPEITIENASNPAQVKGTDFYFDADVVMTAASGAEIYYTEGVVDKSALAEDFDFKTNWTPYTSPWNITESKSYSAVAYEEELPVSDIATATFTLKQYDGDHINPTTTGLIELGTNRGTSFDRQIGAKGAEYKGYAIKGVETGTTDPYMSLSKNETNAVGVVSTVSGGIVQKVVIDFNLSTNAANNRGFHIYGKHTPYTGSDNLYTADEPAEDDLKGVKLATITYNQQKPVVEYIPTEAYEYIGIVPYNNNACYLNEIKVLWGDAILVPQPSVSFANAIWHFDVEDEVVMTPAIEGDDVYYTTDAAKKDAFSTDTWTKYTDPVTVTTSTTFYAVEYRESTGQSSDVLEAHMIQVPAPEHQGKKDVLTVESLGITSTNPDFRHKFGSGTLQPGNDLPDDDGEWTGAIWLGTAGVKKGSIHLDCDYGNGIITTSTGGYVKRVTVEWDAEQTKSGAVFDIYGTNSEVNDIARMDNAEPRCMLSFDGRDKNNISEYTFNGDFRYVGFNSRNVTSSNDDIYIKKIIVEWDSRQEPKFSDRPIVTMEGGLNHFDLEGVVTAEMPATATPGAKIRYKIIQSDRNDLDGTPVTSESVDPDDGTWITYKGPITINMTSSMRFAAQENGKEWSSFVVVRYVLYDLVEGGLDQLNSETMRLSEVSASTFQDIYKRTFESGSIWGGNIMRKNFTPDGSSEQEMYMVIRNNADTASGLVTTSTGGKLDYVVVDWGTYANSGNATLEIYASNDQPFWTTGMYDASKEPVGVLNYADLVTDPEDPNYSNNKSRFDFPRNYRYVGIKAKSTNCYVKEIDVNWLNEEDLISPVFSEVNEADGTVTITQPEGTRPGNSVDIYYVNGNYTEGQAEALFNSQANYDGKKVIKYTGPVTVWDNGVYYAAAVETDADNSIVKVGALTKAYLESVFEKDVLTVASLNIGNVGEEPFYSTFTSGAQFKTNSEKIDDTMSLVSKNQYIHSVVSPGQVARVDLEYNSIMESRLDWYLSQWYMTWDATDGVFDGDHAYSEMSEDGRNCDRSYIYDLNATNYRFIGFSTDETGALLENITIYWLPKEMEDGADPTGDWRFMPVDWDNVDEILIENREYILVVNPSSAENLRAMGLRNGDERGSDDVIATTTELGDIIYLDSSHDVSPFRLEKGVGNDTWAFRFKNVYDRYDDLEIAHGGGGQYLAIQKEETTNNGETNISWKMVTSPVKCHTETLSTDLVISRNQSDASKWEIVFRAVDEAGDANKNLRANTSTSQGVTTTRFKNYGNSGAIPMLYRKIDLETEAQDPYFTPEAGSNAYAFRMKCIDPKADVYYLLKEDFTPENIELLLPNGADPDDFNLNNVKNSDIFTLAEILDGDGCDRIVENGQEVMVPTDGEEHTYYMISHRKQLGKDFYSNLVVGTFTNPNREASTIVDNLNDKHLMLEHATHYTVIETYTEASNARYAMVVDRNATDKSLQISGSACLGGKYYPGIVTTVSGGELKSVTIEWDAPLNGDAASTDQTNEGVTLILYGSTTPFDITLEPSETNHFGKIKSDKGTTVAELARFTYNYADYGENPTKLEKTWVLPEGSTFDYPYIALLGSDSRAAFMKNVAFEWRPRYYNIDDFCRQQSNIDVPFEGTVHVSNVFRSKKQPGKYLIYVHEVVEGQLDRAMLVVTESNPSLQANDHVAKFYAHMGSHNYTTWKAQNQRRRVNRAGVVSVDRKADALDPVNDLMVAVPENGAEIVKGAAANKTSDRTPYTNGLGIEAHSFITLNEVELHYDDDDNLVAETLDGTEFVLDDEFSGIGLTDDESLDLDVDNVYNVYGYVSTNTDPYRLAYVDGPQAVTPAPTIQYNPLSGWNEGQKVNDVTDFYTLCLADQVDNRPDREVEYYYVISSREEYVGLTDEALVALASGVADPVIPSAAAPAPRRAPKASDLYEGVEFTTSATESTQKYVDAEGERPELNSPTIIKAVAVKNGYKVSDVTTIATNGVLPTTVQEIFGEGEDMGDVYTMNGMVIMRDARLADLKLLEPGIYLYRGKKFVVR